MSETAHVPEALLEFRRQLNGLDEQIMRLLGQRFEVCRAVARYKRDHAIPMMQPGRVTEVKERCARMAAEHGIDPEFARQLYGAIIDEACRLEDDIIEEMRASPATGRP